MRLGAPVFDFHSAEEWAARHLEKGYGAAYWPNVAAEEEAAYVEAADKNGLVIAEVGIWNNLLDPDAKAREAALETAIERLRLAERIGARCCVNISGSRSSVWDGPHPLNMTEETFQMVVKTTRAIIDAVRPVRTSYALEPMPWMFPTDAADALRLIEAVDRPAFKVHVDMCNMVNSYAKVYTTGDLTREFFAKLAPHIVSVHAKDTVVEAKKLTLHISEAIPGDGVFDYEALLTECAKLGDVPVMAEHLASEAEYDRATGFIRRKAEELGLSFTQGKKAV